MMCRVAIWYKEKPRFLDDERKYERSHNVPGDPISVMPDGHEWGREEGLPNFASLDMDGVPVKEMAQYCVSEESPILSLRGRPLVMRDRAFNIQIAKLPQAIQDGLRRDGKAAVTLADLRGRILHKETGILR
jgi:hypothetical protein